MSANVWSRQVNGQSLHFTKNKAQHLLTDTNTNSNWDMNGNCTDGALKGSKLTAVQSYQEFWHSWKNFHPAMGLYK